MFLRDEMIQRLVEEKEFESYSSVAEIVRNDLMNVHSSVLSRKEVTEGFVCFITISCANLTVLAGFL